MMNPYPMLLERTSDAVVPFDREGIVRYANQAVEAVFGRATLQREEKTRGALPPGMAP